MKVIPELTRSVPAQRYDFSDEDIELILDRFGALLRSRSFLSMGAYGAEFEQRFAGHTGTSHAVSVNSGTAALEIILRALDVTGSDVIVPTNTFAATAFAVLHAGGRPIFADCGDDLAVDPADVERRLTPATRVVMAVHIGGLVSPSIHALQKLCRSRGLVLVEDAAHAHGSLLHGRGAGTFGEAAGFSFFSTKVMTTGEGGMITTDNEEIARRARLLRDQAKSDGVNRHDTVGYNWRMSEVQAILGLAQLARLDEFVAQRRRVARIYDEIFRHGPDSLRPLAIPDGAEPNYYKYVLFSNLEVGRVAARLAAERRVRLGGAVYDVPCHQQPVFAELADGPLPRAEHLCPRQVCPPIYPSLTDDDARYVAESLIEVVS
jgi:dTDP-4-amino-4,6-dideoxygalactose transaminase